MGSKPCEHQMALLTPLVVEQLPKGARLTHKIVAGSFHGGFLGFGRDAHICSRLLRGAIYCLERWNNIIGNCGSGSRCVRHHKRSLGSFDAISPALIYGSFGYHERQDRVVRSVVVGVCLGMMVVM